MGKTDRNTEAKFLKVREDILPEAIRKTAHVKGLLARGEASTVNEAVDKVALSRSAFYKYKDGVFPLYEGEKGRIVTFSLLLDHKSGVLSTVLNTIANVQGNILTINQGLPLQGMANASVSIDTSQLAEGLDGIVTAMRRIDGVISVELIGEN
ncbi:MAG TPA: ACT domain-containing protein [Bacillota bacterium]|nr:ACT domain-containing protein [Bacillota bacterium]